MSVIKPHLYVWGNCFPIKASPFVHQLTLTCTKQTTTALLTNKNCYRPCKGIVMKAYSDSRLPHLTKYAAYSTAELSRIKVVPIYAPSGIKHLLRLKYLKKMKLLPLTGRYSHQSQEGEKVVHFWQHSTIISNLSSLPEDIDGLQQEKPSCLLLSQATTKAVKLKIHTSTNWWQVFISAQATLFPYLWPQEIDIIFLKSAPCHPQENFFCPAFCSLLTLRHQLAYEQINQLSHVEKASDRKMRNLLSQDKHSTSLGLSSAARGKDSIPPAW